MWIVIGLIIIAVVVFCVKKNASTPIDFSDKTDNEILQLYNSLSEQKKEEVMTFFARQIKIIQVVATTKKIPLDKFNIAKEKEGYYPEEYYGLETYSELKHVYDVISK